MYTVAISGYESEFKNLLRIISSNDSEYNKLKRKCFNRYNNTVDNAYDIDTKGYLRYTNHMYVPNQLNIKQTIFRELPNNPCVGDPGYQKFISALKKYFIGQI